MDRHKNPNTHVASKTDSWITLVKTKKGAHGVAQFLSIILINAVERNVVYLDPERR